MKILVFLLIIVMYLGGNGYAFYRLWVLLPPSLTGRIILFSFAAISILSIILFFTLGESLPIGFSSLLYKIGTSWPFILIYFVIIFLLKDLIGLVNRFLHFMPADALSHYTKDNWVGLGFMIGFIAMLMICGYLKYQWKVKVELPLKVEKTMGKVGDLKIVAVSDLHLGYGIGEDELKKWVSLINAEQPDIVLIAGDLIDNSVRPLNAGHFAEELQKIKATKGVYMCLGNHEYLSGVPQSIDFINKAGIHLLRDSYVEIDSSLYIIGREDKTNSKRKPLSEIVAGLDTSKPMILLDHQPYNLEEAEACGIDFQFSGHTHQGQVWPISLITKAIYEDDHGYIKKGNTNVFVSSGIGIWGGKFRIGTQSEYIVANMTTK